MLVLGTEEHSQAAWSSPVHTSNKLTTLIVGIYLTKEQCCYKKCLEKLDLGHSKPQNSGPWDGTGLWTPPVDL